MKKLIAMVIVFLLLPFIQAFDTEKEIKENKVIKFKDFKEDMMQYPWGRILIRNMEKYGIDDESVGIIIKFMAGMVTQGYGYGFPTMLTFSFFSILPVVWYYIDGTTEFYSLVGKETYRGSYVGAAIIYPLGIWISPRLLQQPGNIFGMGIVAVAVIYPM